MAKSKTRTTKTTTKKAITVATPALASLSKKTSKATKSATPTVTVTDQQQLQAMEAIVDAKNAKKAAESVMKAAEHNLRDAATELFETRCREDADLHTSIRLVGKLEHEDGTTTTPSVMYTQPRMCLKMEEADATDPLRAVFAKDFDSLFVVKQTKK